MADIQNDDKVKKLYDTFVSDGYEMESEEDFRTNLSDAKKRKAAYDALVSDGYDMEPYEEFERNIGFGNANGADGDYGLNEADRHDATTNGVGQDAATGGDETLPYGWFKIEEEQPVQQSWRDEPLNIGVGGDAADVKASTQGAVYDELYQHFGNVRATAKPGDRTAYDQTWQKALEMGIEDDDQLSRTRKLVGTINRRWADELAKDAVNSIMEKMPKRTNDVMGELAALYYDKDLQERLFREAANMGNDYSDYINMFVKPHLQEALKEKYNLDDNGVTGVKGIFSNWEHVTERQEGDDVAGLLSRHFTPAINAAFAAGDERANEAMRQYNEGVSPYSDPGLDFGTVFAMRKGNELRDPKEILKSLQESVGTSMLDMLQDDQLSSEISKRAEAKGMSEADYFDKYVAPQMRDSLTKEFERIAVEREMPKSTVEYVLRGLEDSVIGMVANRLMRTESQQQYRNMADSMTSEGRNTDVKPGLLAEGGRLATGMASDFLLWGGWGKIGAKATQELVGQHIAAVAAERNVTKEVARRLVEEEGKQYMGKGIVEGMMRHIPQSAITMGGAEATTEAVRGIRDREEIGEIIGNTIGAGARGGTTGAAFGVTGGVMGRITSQLSGAKKIMGRLAGLEVEAATMYTTEELQRLANGEEAFGNPLEGLLEANVKLGFIKASANPMATGAKLVEALKNPIKTVKGMAKPDLGTLNEADVADILESSDGTELIDALTAMRPGRSTTGQREGTISAEDALRGAEAYRQYMTDPDRPWERKQKVARLLGGMVPPPGREVSTEISGSNESGYTLRTRDIDGQCVRELHFDSESAAAKAQKDMAHDLTINETEALAQQVDMYDASKRFGEYLDEEYERAAIKLRSSEPLTDGEKQAVYLRQHRGELLDIQNKAGDGQELSEEEQRLGDIYKERFGDYVRSGRASEAFTREFEEGAGLPEGAVRQAVEGHSFADAAAMDSPERLVEVGNGTWRTATEQRVVDGYNEAMRRHVEEMKGASDDGNGYDGVNGINGTGGFHEAGGLDGVDGANGQVVAETETPVEPSAESLQRREAAYNRGAEVVKDQSVLLGIGYDVKLADARMLALFPKDNARLNRIRREIMRAVESGDDGKADELMAQASDSLTPEQREAVEAYRDAMETQRGVEDAVAQQTADYEEQRRAELELVTAQDGSITPLTLQDGSEVYYMAGDMGNKFGGLIVVTKEGERKQIPTASVQSVGERQMATDVINADIDRYAQGLEAAYQGMATGQAFVPGQQADLVFAGRSFKATVQKSDPETGSTFFLLEDGSVMPMTPQEAAKAVADADALKIQAQLQQEKQMAETARQTERFKKGIAGYTEGHPDYSAPESDPKIVAEYLLKDVADNKQRERVLNNIDGEKDLLSQNTQQAWEEYQRAQNALEMADDNLKKARGIQDREAAKRRIIEMQDRQRKWGEIRQAIMTTEERTKFEGERMRTINKHLTASRKTFAGEIAGEPIPTGQELLEQYAGQSDAEAAVAALRKEVTRQWREELYPRLSDVRQMMTEYQQGLAELGSDELQRLTDAVAQLEQQEAALVARNKELKQLAGSLNRLYASRSNAMLTPREKKLNQLGKESDRRKKMQLAREVYADDEIASTILEDEEPHDVYEFVSRNLGYGSINWEGLDRGGHHVRGLQEEFGRDKTRSIGKGSDTQGFNAFLAPKGEGAGIDEIVHGIYESQTGEQRYSTEEIKDALLDMLRNAQRPTDISHRIENSRIAAAEQAWRANEAAEREQMDAEAWERQQSLEEYQDYLDTLSDLLPTDEAENFISGLLADEVAEIEQERMTYEDAMRELVRETETNIEEYGETDNQQESAATEGRRVDKEPQRAAAEEGVGGGKEVVPGAEANQPENEIGDTEQQPQPTMEGKVVGAADADRGVPLEAETDDLAAPEEIEKRVAVNDDYITGESDYGDIYLQTVTIDGRHEVVKVDAPDEKGNYNGSYYEYDGRRFGDLQEVVSYIDGGINGDNGLDGETMKQKHKAESDVTTPTEEDAAIRDVLVEDYLRPAGIKVNTDVEAAEKILADENAAVKAQKAEETDWLNGKEVNIIPAVPGHGFKNFADARKWAKDNIVRIYSNEETGGKGDISISGKAIEKFLSENAVKKSENKDVHLSTLKVLPDVIREGVLAESHPDYKKVDGKRSKENGVNPGVTIHRVYGAVSIGDKTYRVKVTLKEDRTQSVKAKAYSYEATKIELLDGQSAAPAGTPRNSSNSIPVSNLLKGKLLYRFDGGAQTEQQPADLTGWEKLTTGDNGKVSTSTASTQTNPTFSREDLGAVVDSAAKVIQETEKSKDSKIFNTSEEKMTPEQEALLRGHDFREYSSIQELSAGKGSENVGDVQGKAEKNGINGADGETMKRRGAVQNAATEIQMQAYRDAAIKTAEQLGGTEVHFDQRQADDGVKGWFDTGDNSVHVVMDAIESVDDLRRTIFHEKLGHEGLKALFGSNEGVNQWGQFIFGSAGRKLRQRIMERAEREGYGWDDPLRFSKAAQEVFADIAEDGPQTSDEFSLWQKAKHHLIKRLNDIGLRIPGILNDHDMRYYVLKTGEALKTWDGMSAEAQAEAGNRMYSRAGKPRKRKDESMAQYLQRLRNWERWKIAEEAAQAAGDPQPDKEAINRKWEDEFNTAMNEWRTANGISADENGAGEFPKRRDGESPQEYAMRVAEHEERSDVWKGAPDFFDYLQRANEEYRDEYAAWKSRYNLTETENVDLSFYDGANGGNGRNNAVDTNSPEEQEVEARMEQDLAQAVGVATDSDGARRQAKLAVIERRKNLESSNAEDAIWLYNFRKKTEEAAAAMSERTGEKVTGKELREALPQIIEDTYFEEVLRDEDGNVVAINDISDQLPIKKGPELDALLGDIKDWYDEFYHVIEDAGLRYDAGYIAEGYVNHVWDKGKSDPKAWEKYVENYQRTKSPNMRHREIESYRDGMDIGLVPKYNDICDIMAHYSRQNNEAVANKKFLDDLSFIVVEERNSDGEVTANLPLLNSRKPAFVADRYAMYNVPGVGDVWVLKDVQKRFASVFGTMRTPDVSDWLSKLGKGYDLAGSTMKKIQLSISGFHMGALTEVAMAQMRPDRAMQALFKYVVYDSVKAGTIPAYAHPEDFKFAASHLVQLGATQDYAASDVNAITATFREKVKEWYDEENAGKKVAGAAATPLAFALDMVNKGMDKVLWNYLHDGLKIACFKMFAEQIDGRVRKEGLSDEMREQLLDEAGQYVNDTFGGQYWELLNVSPGLLKWMRRAFLSPDWLISTQRHFLANFGFGSLYSEGGFMEYLRYNADNIKRAFGMNIERNELRRFRSSNAKKCYILGVCGFFYTMMNGINAFFRARDERNEREKAEEIRKENPDYRSPYELAYPNGMKWYDYTMLGNSLGQQTHLFVGRYEDGTETYVRWGKQFREFPEMFMGRHGVEFPTPLIERMMGKGNPMISLIRDNLGALGVWGFTNSKDIEEIQSKYGKEIGVLAMNARHFWPYSLPTRSDKEAKAMDFFMPSQKGFTRYKTVDFFKTYILAGDMEGVTRTYQAAVMNGIDAEKCLKAAISTIKATQRKEMQDGVTDLQTAMEKFDAADGKGENAYRTKAALRNKIIAYLAESNYKAFTREEAQEQIDAFMQGDGVAEKDNERYIELLRSEDVRDDYRLSAIGKKAKEYVDKVKTCEDSRLQQELGRRYEAWFAIYGIVNKARSSMNRLKKQLGKGHDVEVMEQIRQVRRQAQTEIDNVEPPR